MKFSKLYCLHFSDYCPHLCRHVYHVSVVVFHVHKPCLMDVNYQLSPANFPSESSPLPSPRIKLTLFWVCHWI